MPLNSKFLGNRFIVNVTGSTPKNKVYFKTLNKFIKFVLMLQQRKKIEKKHKNKQIRIKKITNLILKFLISFLAIILNNKKVIFFFSILTRPFLQKGRKSRRERWRYSNKPVIYRAVSKRILELPSSVFGRLSPVITL